MSPPDDDWNRIRAQLARVTPSLETSETLPFLVILVILGVIFLGIFFGIGLFVVESGVQLENLVDKREKYERCVEEYKKGISTPQGQEWMRQVMEDCASEAGLPISE